MFFGIAAIIEMVYHMQLNEALGPVMRFLGIELNVQSIASWLGAAVVAAIGIVLFELTRRRFALRWGDVQGEIEASIRAREAG
jgi:branched-chain amino acid transport system permease protein